MRPTFLLTALLAALVCATPAMAGKVSYADGQGKWVPTGCTAPQAPSALPRDPEAAANDLNARMMEHNSYAAEAEAYMACVSREAQSDAESFGVLITSSAQNLINQTQSDVAASAARAHSSQK